MKTLVVLCAAALAVVRPACADVGSARPARETVFFVGCHPDDIENCLGLMLKMRTKYDIQVIDFTRTEARRLRGGLHDVHGRPHQGRRS